MPSKSNEDSIFVNPIKLERPPLKKPKTLSIPSSSSASTNSKRFDLEGVSIENNNGISSSSNNSSSRDFFFPNEQWKYPSFLGTTRRKRNTVKPSKVKHDVQFDGGVHKKAGNNGISSVVQAKPSASAAATSSSCCSLSASSSSGVSLQEHSVTRRHHPSKQNSILYLVSDCDLIELDVIFFYLLY